MWRQDLPLGLAAQRSLELGDHLLERNRLAAGKVEYRPRLRDVESGNDPVDHIVDKGVVPVGACAAENRDRPTFDYASGKLVEREIGPLPGSVDGEETEDGYPGHLVGERSTEG